MRGILTIRTPKKKKDGRREKELRSIVNKKKEKVFLTRRGLFGGGWWGGGGWGTPDTSKSREKRFGSVQGWKLLGGAGVVI